MKKQLMILSILGLFGTAGMAQDLANNELHTGTTFHLKNKQRQGATYQASKAITLTTGFKVEKGQKFKATLANAATIQQTIERNLTITGNTQQHTIKVALQNQAATQGAQVYLYNDRGGMVGSQPMTNSEALFSMGQQKPGIYIVRYVQGDQIVSKKILFK